MWHVMILSETLIEWAFLLTIYSSEKMSVTFQKKESKMLHESWFKESDNYFFNGELSRYKLSTEYINTRIIQPLIKTEFISED